MNSQRLYVQKQTRNLKNRPSGWYVVKAGSNGRVTAYVAGPFKSSDEAVAARARK